MFLAGSARTVWGGRWRHCSGPRGSLGFPPHCTRMWCRVRFKGQGARCLQTFLRGKPVDGHLGSSKWLLMPSLKGGGGRNPTFSQLQQPYLWWPAWAPRGAPSWGPLSGQGSSSSVEQSELRAGAWPCCLLSTPKPSRLQGRVREPPLRLCIGTGHIDDYELLSLSLKGVLRGTPALGEGTFTTSTVHGLVVPRELIGPPRARGKDARPLPALGDCARDRRPHLSRSPGLVSRSQPCLVAGRERRLPRVFTKLSCSLKPFTSMRLCLGDGRVNARVCPWP